MDPLLHLMDHPARDPDALRNPVLTRQIMERVRAAVAARPAALPWWPLAVIAALLALLPIEVEAGALAAAFTPGLIGELLVAVALALGVLMALRRPA